MPRILFVLFFFAVLGPKTAGGQSIQGTVLDALSGTPVPLAAVFLLGSDLSVVGQTLSREDGSFLLEAPHGGFYRMRISGMGLADYESSLFALGDTETIEFEIRATASPVELERLLVEVRGDRGRDRFQRRLERGVGFFLDRAQLDTIDPVDFVDIFRAVDGVRMSWSFMEQDDGGSRPTPTIKAGPQNCMTYLLDDRPVRGGIGDNRSPLALFPLSGLRMDDIQAVEVYRDLGEVPEEIRNSAFRPVWGKNLSYYELTCGITVFRTKVRW